MGQNMHLKWEKTWTAITAVRTARLPKMVKASSVASEAATWCRADIFSLRTPSGPGSRGEEEIVVDVLEVLQKHLCLV